MVRYLIARKPSAYFVAMPNKAAAIIQNNAPGPPAASAVATPTMFPVPMVADNAVQSAAKLETSPSPPSSFLTINFRAFPRCRNCSPQHRIVSQMPHAIIRTISGMPQTKSSMLLMILFKLSIFINPPILFLILKIRRQGRWMCVPCLLFVS